MKSRCRYCGERATKIFLFFEHEIPMCEDCSRCFICGESVDPGEEIFFAIRKEDLPLDLEKLLRVNRGRRLIVGRRDVGLIVHRSCLQCEDCGSRYPDVLVGVEVSEEGRIAFRCSSCSLC